MHERISIHQVCFPASSISAFAQSCRTIGAGRMSIASPSLLTEGGTSESRSAVRNHGLIIETINHPFGIHANLEEDEGRAAETLMRVIDIGAELGARSIYLLTGGRGGLSWEAAADGFAERVAPCAEAARQAGLALMIENAPALYADIHIAHSLADTIRLAEQAKIGVCVELFFCWGDAGLGDLLRHALPRCGLVQLSDYVLGDRSLPARAVPGDGVIPLEAIISELLDAGYGGAFDIELIGPRIDAEGHLAATTRAAQHVSAMLERLGA
ncbi:sugar phosphate isomerase/epimerase family protein [Sphingomonas cavernae]|uniref:Sugar phosphate isomerase/epimerase n=1 Tax=Sphingomonas cavernae TaxID=2320861 RepID=A0A418WMR5_9SPHN|nr:sugar phosphate isomerase/epimerase family protein [Sphingomonas cavernae]RJF91287.1 sugar phosphate isomerase/epimerase [Sphingomonas cavernae]